VSSPRAAEFQDFRWKLKSSAEVLDFQRNFLFSS
jgi:hypothetical protein